VYQVGFHYTEIQHKFEILAACQAAAATWIYCVLFEVTMTVTTSTPTPTPA